MSTVTVKPVTTVNVRLTPGYKNKDSYDVKTSLPAGVLLTVDKEEVLQDEIWWLKIVLGPADSAGCYVARFSPSGDPLVVNCILTPVESHIPVTQEFGENPAFYSQIQGYPVPLKGHNGRDYGTPIGTPIFAVEEGHVIAAGFDASGFGNRVKLKHDFGETLYAHCSELHVTEGQSVTRGQVIALAGDSGLGSGPHLHFGLRIDPYDRADGWGGFRDPRELLESV